MKKIVIFLSKKTVVDNSGVGKYIYPYYDIIKNSNDVELYYQPENTGLFWRFFVLNKIIKNKYNNYIKIFTDENFLPSLRRDIAKNSIVIVHHYPFLTKVTNLKETLVKYLSFFTFKKLRYINNIVVVSEFTQDTLVNYLHLKKDNIHLIYNSFNLSDYVPLKNEQDRQAKREYLCNKFNIPSNHNILLFVGSDESRKNLGTVLRAINGLNDFVLVRVGKKISPDETKKIESYIEQQKLNIVNLVDVSEEDLISFYQSSDLFVCTSLFEGFGRTPVEAQACGCRVISTHSGALKEVLGDSIYLLDNPMDSLNLRAMIIRLMGDLPFSTDLINKGLKNAQKYDVTTGGRSWLDLIAKIAKE